MSIEHSSRAKIVDVREERRAVNPIELRQDAKSLILEGYAATFEPYDCYGGVERGGWIEQIAPHAFDKTLRNNPDVQLLINHGDLPLARTKSGTLKLSVTPKRGLKVRAVLEPSDPDVQKIAPKMKRGDLNEMSFAFRVLDQVWNNDFSHRLITEVSLQRGDVSIVSYGMNPDTKALLSEEAVAALARMSQDELVELRNLDPGQIERAIEVLSKAKLVPVSIPTVGVTGPRRNTPGPGMPSAKVVADGAKDPDPSDPEGGEIQGGIHDAPPVAKTGDSNSPVKMELDPVTPLQLTLVAALESTISHAHSVAVSNGDSARSLLAEAVDQIAKLRTDIESAPRAASALDRYLEDVRSVGTSPTGPNPFPQPSSDDEWEIENDDIIDDPDFNGSGDPQDGLTTHYDPQDIVQGDPDDPSTGMPAVQDHQQQDVLAITAEELAGLGDADDTADDEGVGQVEQALRAIRREKGVPVIRSVSEGLRYLAENKAPQAFH